MKYVVIVVVGGLLVIRLAFHLRRRPKEKAAPRVFGRNFTNSLAIVTSREIQERVRGRIFRFGTLIILLVVAGAIVIPVLDRGSAPVERIGVFGTLSATVQETMDATSRSIGLAIRVVPEPTLLTGIKSVEHGSVDVLLVDSKSLIIAENFSASDTSSAAIFVPALAEGIGETLARQSAHLSTDQSEILAHAQAIPVTSLMRNTAKPLNGTAVIGLILLFVMLTQYNAWILLGVMEEKSSRVVEVLLATVRPLQLLAGKVLGIGLVASGQALLIVAFALGLSKAVGSSLLHGSAPLALASTLVWLVLGFAFYCWVYAAAGSMAERQDQVQTLAFPLSLPILFGYIISLTAASSGNASTFFKVLAYLPPTAPFAMPVLVGFGEVQWWQFAASALLSIIATFFVARAASTIYRRAILRTGQRVRMRELFANAHR